MKKVILTFDDGPSKEFPKLIDYLIKQKIIAIFFCLGKNLEKKENEKYLIKAIKEGFVIANHSYSHPFFNSISYKKGKEEIIKTDELIERLYEKAKVKRKYKFFRFPYLKEGGYNFFRYQKLLEKLGYNNPFFKRRFLNTVKSASFMFLGYFLQGIYVGKNDFYMGVDTLDYLKNSRFSLTKKALRKTSSGDILIMHDHLNNLEKTTKKTIKFLKKRGFTFVIQPS